MEDQMCQVKAGKDLSSLERIPNPVAPPQLAVVQSMMMRPGFYPMMPLPRAPFPMGPGMMRPQMGGSQQPQMGGVPVPMVSIAYERGTLSSDKGSKVNVENYQVTIHRM